MSDIRLRPAGLNDRETLRRWDNAPHVQENAGDDDPWDWEVELARNVDWQQMFVAELRTGGHLRPIGFLQIIDPAREETHYWGDVPENLRAIDIWIGEVDCLNQGHGTQMMRLAITQCFSNPDVTAILIDPLERNLRARNFYERLGFRFVENRRFGPDDCAIYRLTREDSG